MSGAPSGPAIEMSSWATRGFSGISSEASTAEAVARRACMSGIALKPPGNASRKASRLTRDSGSIRSRWDMLLALVVGVWRWYRPGGEMTLEQITGVMAEAAARLVDAK